MGGEKASTVSCFSVCNQNNQIQPRAGGGKRRQQGGRKRTRGGAKEQASRALPAALGAVADLASTVREQAGVRETHSERQQGTWHKLMVSRRWRQG